MRKLVSLEFLYLTFPNDYVDTLVTIILYDARRMESAYVLAEIPCNCFSLELIRQWVTDLNESRALQQDRRYILYCNYVDAWEE